MLNNIYYKQAELLLRVLPIIDRENEFALKGGTALNFFWRDFPRLSVDIDLTYLPVKERNESLKDINDKLLNIRDGISRTIAETNITGRTTEGNLLSGLLVRNNESTIKVEVNTVIRGSVFPAERKRLCDKAEDIFELSVSVQTLSFADLYGGKICAALDRQHPRDLFDIKLLLDNEGITENIRKAFIVYLVSHNRPINEVLNPGLQAIRPVFENEFAGMTEQETSLEDLVNVRSLLIEIIRNELTADEKKFLLSFKSMNPQWELLGLNGIENLPSVKWKLINLAKMKAKEHEMAYKKLEEYLS
ncbi:MAG: nucleotidyl transferase AbiEii/AbiGii toxin family protein [Ignavibacteriaceae bacterium]